MVNKMESEYNDMDYHGEDLNEEDWITEEEQSNTESSKVELAIVEELSKKVETEEQKAKRDGFKGSQLKWKGEGTLKEYFNFLNSKLDEILAYYKEHPKSKKYQKPKNEYPYPYYEGQIKLADAITERLSKESWWNNVSEEARDKQVRTEMLRVAFGTRGQNDKVLEKAYLSKSLEYLNSIEDDINGLKCPYDDLKFSSKIELMDHLEKFHPAEWEKLMDALLVIQAQETKPSSQSEKVQHPNVQMPQPTPLPNVQRIDFEPYIKEYNKTIKLSKEELSQLETLHQEFPDLNPRELDRLRLLRRSK